jgi:hypothetical protein
MIFRSLARLGGISCSEPFVWSFAVAALFLALLVFGAVGFVIVSFDFPDEPRA